MKICIVSYSINNNAWFLPYEFEDSNKLGREKKADKEEASSTTKSVIFALL